MYVDAQNLAEPALSIRPEDCRRDDRMRDVKLAEQLSMVVKP